jgi:hypothetical protein
VGRWLNGVLQPSDHSLTTLTTVLAKHLPQFDRVAWEAPIAEFARRLGVQSAATAQPPDASPVLPRAVQTTASTRAFAEDRYAALWMRVFASPGLHGRISFLPMRIGWQKGGAAMPIEYVYRPVVHLRGVAFDLAGWLFGVMESQLNGKLGFLALEGVAHETPLLLDGLLTASRATAVPAIFCVRVLAFRLGALPDEAGFLAVADRAAQCTRDGAGDRLPEAMRAAFRMPASAAPGPYWIVHEQTDSWTTSDIRSQDASRAPQMEALAAVRALFANLLPPETP